MEYSFTHTHPEKQHTSCLVVGVFEKDKLSATAEQIDAISNGYLTKLVNRGDLSGKIDHQLLLQDVPNLPAPRLLLVGCGKQEEFTATQFRKVIAKAITTLKTTGSLEVTFYTSDWIVKDYDLFWQITHLVKTVGDQLYRFEELKSKKEEEPFSLRKIIFHLPSEEEYGKAQKALLAGEALTQGITLFKDLVNLPGNHCTPSYLAETAKNLVKKHRNLKLKVYEEGEMKKLGMGALLSVARGSKEPAKLIVLHYNGAANNQEQPIALVGKGVTFDAGGLSLKSPSGMMDMKYDMAGAGCVLGLIHAACALALPINLVGVIPTTENLPGGRATKPGDVVTSFSGQTVEILNTDAEGRLILCDALTYVGRYNPAFVIDIATLTGAIVVALGHHRTGIFTNHDPLASSLIQAGEKAVDKAWCMPLDEEYNEQLKSPVADMANISKGRDAGSVTAACYLSRFTSEYAWAHLDIAGTAWSHGENKGPTGRPLPLLFQFLLNQCNLKDE